MKGEADQQKPGRPEPRQALPEPETRLRRVFESASDGVWLVSVGSEGTIRFLELNPAAERLFGVTSGDAAGKAPTEVLPPGVAAQLVRNCRSCLEAGTPFSCEESFELPTGRRWLHTLLVPLQATKGTMAELAGLSRDVTDRKQAETTIAALEAQLQHAQRMEAIGTLASGIAHDFNNILAAIIPFAHLAKMDAGDNTPVHESLDQVLKAADRAKDLVKQILAFSRQEKQERQVLALPPIIKEGLKLLRSALPATVEMVADIQNDTPRVLADPTEIHQALFCLCTSAGQTMAGKPGRLEVRLEAFPVDEHFAHQPLELRPGVYVRLTVSDTGQGMDAEALKRKFAPVLPGPGAAATPNLGLAVVQGIVRSYGGTLHAESQPGLGTTVQVYLPAHGPQPERLDLGAQPIPRGNGQHLLFVDDEPALCGAARRMLESLGYRVTAQTSPLEALTVFRQSPAAFDLVLTDLTMPGMTGVDLALVILGIRPEVPVILATGFSGLWTQEAASRLGIREIVLKPVAPAGLAKAIHKALNPPAGAESPG